MRANGAVARDAERAVRMWEKAVECTPRTTECTRRCAAEASPGGGGEYTTTGVSVS